VRFAHRHVRDDGPVDPAGAAAPASHRGRAPRWGDGTDVSAAGFSGLSRGHRSLPRRPDLARAAGGARTRLVDLAPYLARYRFPNTGGTAARAKRVKIRHKLQRPAHRQNMTP